MIFWSGDIQVFSLINIVLLENRKKKLKKYKKVCANYSIWYHAYLTNIFLEQKKESYPKLVAVPPICHNFQESKQNEQL